MLRQTYKKQAELLLQTLPEIAKESCFALHGGTAINLFIRDMPRLSVDIDLTYVPIEDRESSLKNIDEALARVRNRLASVIPGVVIQHRRETGKLSVASHGIEIKIEVNLVGRGIIAEAINKSLCEKAQVEFDVFVQVPVVPIGQLFGGKICAALDRQHPRDLFDVKYLLENEGITDEIMRGFIYCLCGSDRPIHEIIFPHLQNQQAALVNQFDEMAREEFSYDEYQAVRERLVKQINESLSFRERQFLLAFHNNEPDWREYDFSAFPSIQWKLQNLEKLKNVNPAKHREQYEALKKKLQL